MATQKQSAKVYHVTGKRTHSHFADRMAQTFVDACLRQRDPIELTSVQIDHWTLAGLLTK